jgi:hypothetical protein
LSRHAIIGTLKMLHDARMAAMRIATAALSSAGWWPLWAGSVGQVFLHLQNAGGAAFGKECSELPFAANVIKVRSGPDSTAGHHCARCYKTSL